MTEWRKVRLGDISQNNISTYSLSEKWDFVNYLDTGNVTQNVIDSIQFIELKKEKLPSRARRKVRLNDIIYSTVRPNQQHYGRITKEIENLLVSTGFAVITVDPVQADSKFVYYVITQKEYTEKLQTIAEQNVSTYPSIKPSDLEDLVLCLPPLEIQRKIAGILGALDDKIEVLREQNKTLEQMAQAVFQSWFVDFDIVRAKAAGLPAADVCKKYRITPDIYDLFPSAFSADNLPLGWEKKSLPEIAIYLNGLPLQKFPPKNENEFLPVIKIAELKARSTVGADKSSTEIDPKYIIDDGDVIFSWSGSLAVDIWCCGKGALNQHLFKVSSNDYPKWFYYLWTKKYLFQFQQIAAGKATTMGHIQRSHLEQAKAIVPSEKILERANRIISPLIEKVIENSKQIRTLEQTRDTLLPQLLNGKIDVENVSLSSINDEV